MLSTEVETGTVKRHLICHYAALRCKSNYCFKVADCILKISAIASLLIPFMEIFRIKSMVVDSFYEGYDSRAYALMMEKLSAINAIVKILIFGNYEFITIGFVLQARKSLH